MNQKQSPDQEKKKFLGIYFRCCNVYARIYRNKAGTAYEGSCPNCHRKAMVQIGDKGTNTRFFIAD